MSDSARGSIIFVNRYFWPDRSATSQILSDVAFHLAENGYAVEVIASRLSYESDESPYPADETHRGVRIHRVATPSFGRGNIIGRLIDYLGFYVSAFFKTLSLAGAKDVVVAKTDPPVLSWPIGIAAGLKGARKANWLQDLYPEVAEAFGVIGINSVPARLTRALRDRSLRKADMNIAIGEKMAELLAQRGVETERITVIPNMTDDESIRPIHAADNPLRKEWGFAETDLVVGYSGNLGRAHEVDTLLSAAQSLQEKGRSDIRFLVIGGGFLREHLEREVEARTLSNFTFKPYQPREQLGHSLTVPDVHWVSLLPELEGLIVPSKFYGAAASGRPVIFIGSTEGELGGIVPESNSGAVIAVNDAESLAERLIQYADDSVYRAQQGKNARALVEQGFNRRAVLSQWEALAAKLAPRG
ncbi:glycosyltransferase family 4 protein [Aurantiacibacter sediminis]|uniref:Glycosyltransferase family 4 protein n=1 Tax=Aurantiacibacter sediminis TaxID=2793064 RepID=A0ABS0N374_9SPHN|nr:glycosyltransferase family 4 protein [Aurantiacibacter sediminis]MBH5322423.1 glycosyltransferase family 4 protein [Aurantiacibacter sediminis]